MEDLATRTLLGGADVDALAAMVHNLLGELTLLAERVAALEGADPAGAPARIAALTNRVLAERR